MYCALYAKFSFAWKNTLLISFLVQEEIHCLTLHLAIKSK